MRRISDVGYLAAQLENIVNIYGGIKEFMVASGAKRQTLRRIMLGKPCRLSTVERFAEYDNKSIAEMFLDPDVETEWYRDSALEYVSPNIRKISEASEMDIETIAVCANILPQTYELYLAGLMYPMTNTLQRIANVLEVEVADLFLPMEGSE